MVLSDLCKENKYCKTASLNACGLLLLLWRNLENISRILIFADLDLLRNCAKIGCAKIFHFTVYANYIIKSTVVFVKKCENLLQKILTFFQQKITVYL